MLQNLSDLHLFEDLPDSVTQEIKEMIDVPVEDAYMPDFDAEDPSVSEDMEEEISKEENECRHLNLSRVATDTILKANESDFAKRVVQTLLDVQKKERCDIIEYPTSMPDIRTFLFYFSGKMGGSVNVEFKDDLKYSFGDNRTIETRNMCDMDKTVVALAKEFEGKIYFGIYAKTQLFIVVPGAVFLLMLCGMNTITDLTDRDLLYRFMKCVVWKEASRVKMVDYVVFDRSFRTTSLKVRKQECDVKMNYNDDIPDEKIFNWINSNESGLMVLHGEPGTGKTSYIRDLVYRTKNRFMFFDKSLFQHMTDASLIEMLLEHRNSIIVLEDCEDLLTDRTGFGSCMTTILNLTDGILGDSLRFKFICTFNADIVDIDPAILRKGRMRLKYEFKKLDGKKAVALGKKLGVDVPEKEMALCEVYNFVEDNGKPPEKEKAKVGF